MIFALVLSNLAGGGAERAMLRLAVALKRRGHGVRVIVLDPKIEHEVPPELELHTLHTRKGLLGAWLAAHALRGLYRRLGLGADCVTISTLPFADLVAARANVANLWCRITNTLSAEIGELERASPSKAARRLARYRRLYEGRNLVAVSDGVAADLRAGIGLRRAAHRAHLQRLRPGRDSPRGGPARAGPAERAVRDPRRPLHAAKTARCAARRVEARRARAQARAPYRIEPGARIADFEARPAAAGLGRRIPAQSLSLDARRGAARAVLGSRGHAQCPRRSARLRYPGRQHRLPIRAPRGDAGRARTLSGCHPAARTRSPPQCVRRSPHRGRRRARCHRSSRKLEW
jgi:hypothetical protein